LVILCFALDIILCFALDISLLVILLWMIRFWLFCDVSFGFCGFVILSGIFDFLMLPKRERNSG